VAAPPIKESPKVPETRVTSSVKRKVTLYFNATMLAETQREAIRQDRSISWIIQAAWRLARDEVRRLPAGAATSDPGSAATGTDPQSEASR
jgi:uncharacterized small protein (TIGR04563 family)